MLTQRGKVGQYQQNGDPSIPKSKSQETNTKVENIFFFYLQSENAAASSRKIYSCRFDLPFLVVKGVGSVAAATPPAGAQEAEEPRSHFLENLGSELQFWKYSSELEGD